jgi:hypothetical protein
MCMWVSNHFLLFPPIFCLEASHVWVGPATVQLTIPTDLKVGMIYYLGAVVDYQNNIGEFNEANNSSYLQIKIVNQ